MQTWGHFFPIKHMYTQWFCTTFCWSIVHNFVIKHFIAFGGVLALWLSSLRWTSTSRDSIDYIEAAAQNLVLSGTFFLFIVNQEGLVRNPMHLLVNNLDIFDKCRITRCQFSVKHWFDWVKSRYNNYCNLKVPVCGNWHRLMVRNYIESNVHSLFYLHYSFTWKCVHSVQPNKTRTWLSRWMWSFPNIFPVLGARQCTEDFQFGVQWIQVKCDHVNGWR